MRETFYILKITEKSWITVILRKLGSKTKRKTEKEESEKQLDFSCSRVACVKKGARTPKSEFYCLFEVFYSLLTENDKA